MLEINDVFTIKISMTTQNLIMVRKKSEKVGNRVIKAKPRECFFLNQKQTENRSGGSKTGEKKCFCQKCEIKPNQYIPV